MKCASEVLIEANIEMSGEAPVQAATGKYFVCGYDISMSEAWKRVFASVVATSLVSLAG